MIIALIQLVAIAFFSILFGLLMPVIPEPVEKATGAMTVLFTYNTLITFLVWWIYFAVLDSSHNQATVGKNVLGLKVVDYSGNRIGFWRASLRYVGMYVSIVLLPITLLVVAFSSKKQGLHDMVANCLIVYK